MFERAVVGAFGIIGKNAGGQFSHVEMIADTVATDAFARARFIAAVA